MTTDTQRITAEELLAHAGWLQRLAARLVEPGSADDFVQDTWVAALQSPPDADRPPRAWLSTVMKNLVRNRARTGKRWQARAARVAAIDDAPLPTAEDLLAHHQAQRLVAELVAELDEPFRSTVLFCYGQGLAPTELANRLNIAPGTVRWRLKRGLDDLRAKLDARHGGDRRAWCTALAPLAATAIRVAAKSTVVATAAAVAVAVGLAAVGTVVAFRAQEDPIADSTVAETLMVPAARPSRAAEPPPAPPSPPSGEPPATAVAAAAVPGQPAARTKQEAIRQAMQPGTAPTRGPADAPVTVVVFSEFQCPFCARVVPTVNDLLAAYPKEVRFIWRNLPLPFHEHAALAAEAALAAKAQGKFWEMHDRLFQHQSALDPPALTEHAKAIGLDVQKFQRALDTQEFRAAVEEDAKLATDAGFNGTPSFIINGAELSGAQPLDAFKQAVERALGRRGAEAAKAPPAPPSPEALAAANTVGAAPTKGDAAAPVTLIMYGGYQCPFSARGMRVVEEVLAAHPKQVRLAWKNHPLPFHERGQLAAEAAMAAREQGKFWEMHARLFSNPDALGRPGLEAHAAALGLDVAAFKKALDERKFQKAVEDDARVAQAARLHGSPVFLVNGKKMMGVDPDRLKNLVEREIARAAGLPLPPELPMPSPDGMRHAVAPGPAWPPPRVALPDELLGDPARVTFGVSDAPMLGKSNAPVEIVYLNDYACGPCGKARAIIAGIRQTYGDAVRIVARPVPFSSRDEKARPFAEAAWAAHAQGKFWELHERMFPTGADARVEIAAKDAGLDVDALKAALESGQHRAAVTEDLDRTREAGLRVRPLFIVNGRAAAGPLALPLLIEAALKKAGRPVPRVQPTPADARALKEATPAQRFFLETRDGAWAEELERALAPLVSTDLRAIDPSVRGVRFECKSESCRIAWQTGKLGNAPLRTYLETVYRGVSFAGAAPAGPGAQPRPEIFVLRNELAGSLGADTVKRIRSRRAGILYSLRTGRTRIEGISPERLPKE